LKEKVQHLTATFNLNLLFAASEILTFELLNYLFRIKWCTIMTTNMINCRKNLFFCYSWYLCKSVVTRPT